MQTRKVLYMTTVRPDRSEARNTAVKMQISAYGYDEVRQVSQAQFVAMSQAEINTYHMVVVYDNAWATLLENIPVLETFYNQGGIVLQDGNDNLSGRNPFIDNFIVSGNNGAIDC